MLGTISSALKMKFLVISHHSPSVGNYSNIWVTYPRPMKCKRSFDSNFCVCNFVCSRICSLSRNLSSFMKRFRIIFEYRPYPFFLPAMMYPLFVNVVTSSSVGLCLIFFFFWFWWDCGDFGQVLKCSHQVTGFLITLPLSFFGSRPFRLGSCDSPVCCVIGWWTMKN